MNHLFIIFSENGKLHTCCEKLVSSTYEDILKETRMCYLNGKRFHLPIVKEDGDFEESGILLVYDAHENDAHDKEKTLTALKKISTKYSHLYVCYHSRSANSWEEEINALGLLLAKKHIIKSHTDKPYTFLHEFHEGDKSIQDLIDFWHEEEEIQKQKIINSLCYAIEEARANDDEKYLDSDSVMSLVDECDFDAAKLLEYRLLRQMIADRVDDIQFNEALNKFRTNKDKL